MEEGTVLYGPFTERIACDIEEYGMRERGLETSPCSFMAVDITMDLDNETKEKKLGPAFAYKEDFEKFIFIPMR